MGKYKVAIIGAGSIGALKPDHLDNKGTAPLTHANAVDRDPDLELVQIWDTDKQRMANASKKWGVPVSEKLTELADIYVIACDTKAHGSAWQQIPKAGKSVVFEKPVANSELEAASIGLGAIANDTKIHVNYSRRYVKEFQYLSDEFFKIDTNLGLAANAAILKYGRGLKRDGCHGINLFNWWFGDFEGAVSSFSGVPDGTGDDSSIAAILRYTQCAHVHLIPIDSRDYSIFEMEIHTPFERLLLVDNGDKLIRFKAENEGTYGDYKAIKWLEKSTHLTDLTSALPLLYEDVKDCREDWHRMPLVTMDSAVKTHHVIECIRRAHA